MKTRDLEFSPLPVPVGDLQPPGQLMLFRTQLEPPAERERLAFVGGLVCPPEEDRTRQEFREDTDINILLKRYGVGALNRTPTEFSDRDYDVSLHDAMIASQAADAAYNALDPDVRRAYPTWAHFVQAVESGLFNTDGSAVGGSPADGGAVVPPTGAPPTL